MHGNICRITRDPLFFVFFLISYIYVPIQFLDRCYTKSVVFYYVVASCIVSLFIWYGCNLIIEKWNRRIKVLLIWLSSFFCALNAFVWEKFENIISPGILDILAATNVGEVTEFCSTYLSISWILLCGIIPLLWSSIYVFLRSICRYSPSWFIGCQFLIILLSTSLTFYSPVLMKEAIVGDLWSFSMDDHVDLYQHLTNPILTETRADHPQKVVVIIGESFSRSHSSLFGYTHETNPELKVLLNEGDLILFSQVTSPAPGTLEAFRQILGTYNPEQCTKKWYDCTNLIEVARQLGYRTSWNSNQSCLPMFDDVCGTYARFCDECYFNKEDGSGYDDYLLRFNYSNRKEKDFAFYHLMGQHGKYAMRFPQKFAQFSADDYIDLPENQRVVLADYDNATLFNDFVVASLMKLYTREDAVVFYFPDHGQDLFETDQENFGHGRLGNPASIEVATQIPLVIYTNETFRKQHPDVIQYLSNIKDNPLNTTSFYKLVLDVMGYHMKEQ